MSEKESRWSEVLELFGKLAWAGLLNAEEIKQVGGLRLDNIIPKLLGCEYVENIAFEDETPLLVINFEMALVVASEEGGVQSVTAKSLDGFPICCFVEDKGIWLLQSDDPENTDRKHRVLFEHLFPEDDKNYHQHVPENWRRMVALSQAIGYLK